MIEANKLNGPSKSTQVDKGAPCYIKLTGENLRLYVQTYVVKIWTIRM